MKAAARIHSPAPVPSDLLGRNSLAAFIAALDAVPPTAGYEDLGKDATRMLRTIAAREGEAAAEQFARLAMRELLQRSAAGELWRVLPASILPLVRQQHARILAALDSHPFGHYRPFGDAFLKDLALCRLRLLPVGAQMVELSCGPTHRPLFTGGLRQSLRFGRAWLRRLSPMYEIHTHREALEEFTETGWNRCYLRIADLLAAHQRVRGLYGGSWFYDPQLDRISPHLGYLRRVPLSGGAQLFRLGPDFSGNALVKSASRRALYDKGEYHPMRYLLVWHRDDLLAWAAAQRRQAA